MPRRGAGPLTREAWELLLELLELPAPALSGASAVEQYQREFTLLRSHGVLVPDGHEAAVASPLDGTPVSVFWDEERGGYGMFDAAAGRRQIEAERLARYRVAIPEMLDQLAAGLRRGVRPVVTEVLAGQVWDVGTALLPGRAHRASVWFARRLFDQQTSKQTIVLTRARPPEGARVLLTSTPPARLADAGWPGHVIVSLYDLQPKDSGLALDPAVLARRLGSTPSAPEHPDVQVYEEGRRVVLRGKSFRFPRGDKQRQVIVYLYEQLLLGREAVPWSEVIAELDLSESARLRDLFNRHPAFGALVQQKHGMCGFCL